MVEICCCHFSDVGRWILVFSDENSCARKAAPYCAAEYSFRKAKCKINFRKWKGGKACSERSVYFGRDGWYCDSKGFYGVVYRQIGVGEDTLVYNQMETLTGMEYTLTLSDGTRVYLNAESRLKYPVVFRGTERVVELSGEAYFKVSKDALRPFVVKMNGVNVRVLGTSFNVRSYADEGQVVTTLVEGKVKVNDQDIVAGEQAVYSKNDGKTTVRQVEVEQYVAWQEGTFVFRNERLENVMKTLGRWYGVEFHFIDERAKEIRIGARFGRYDDMQPIVDMIKKTNLVEVLQTNRCLYISEKK